MIKLLFAELTPNPKLPTLVTKPPLTIKALPVAAAPLPIVRLTLALLPLVAKFQTAFEATLTTALAAPLPMITVPAPVLFVHAATVKFEPPSMFQSSLTLKVWLE